MGMDSPEEKAQITLEQIKNQITLGELEVKRLRGLAAGEEYTLAELVKSKQDHQASIVSAQEQLQQHNADIKKLNDEVNTLGSMLQAGKDEARKYQQQKAKAVKIIEESDSRLKENEKRFEKIKTETTELMEKADSREEIVSSREKAFEVNLAKFKDLIEELEEV